MKTALLLQYMIRNDITFESTSKSCVTRMAGQDAVLYPGACSFVCLAGTSLQTLRIRILTDLAKRFLLPSRVLPKERFSFPNGVHSDEIFFVPRFSYPQQSTS